MRLENSRRLAWQNFGDPILLWWVRAKKLKPKTVFGKLGVWVRWGKTRQRLATTRLMPISTVGGCYRNQKLKTKTWFWTYLVCVNVNLAATRRINACAVWVVVFNGVFPPHHFRTYWVYWCVWQKSPRLPLFQLMRIPVGPQKNSKPKILDKLDILGAFGPPADA